MNHKDLVAWYAEAIDNGKSHDFALYYVVGMYVKTLTPPEALSAWIPVTESLPEGKHGVPYMEYMTDTVLVLHSDRPDYPITAHASLTDNDSGNLGIRINTNGASKYRWISWRSAGRDLCNPFDLKDQDYTRFLPRIFGSKITHWQPITLTPSPQARREEP